MKERTENPDPIIVQGCCQKCPLLPSKPGYENVNQNVIAAAESANRLKRLIDANIANLVFKDKDDLGARRVAALFGYLNAESKSESNRFKELEKDTEKRNSKNKTKFRPEDYF
jgi:hypothetical protein